MKTKEIAVVVGVALIVSLVVAIVSTTITGNLIRVNAKNRLWYSEPVYNISEVYNKIEIDAKLNILPACIHESLAIHELFEMGSGTYTICGKSYTVTPTIITGTGTTGEVVFEVNRQSTGILSKGQSRILFDGAYISVKDITAESGFAEARKEVFFTIWQTNLP